MYGGLISLLTLFMDFILKIISEKYALIIVFIIPGIIVVIFSVIKLTLFTKRNKIRGDEYGS